MEYWYWYPFGVLYFAVEFFDNEDFWWHVRPRNNWDMAGICLFLGVLWPLVVFVTFVMVTIRFGRWLVRK